MSVQSNGMTYTADTTKTYLTKEVVELVNKASNIFYALECVDLDTSFASSKLQMHGFKRWFGCESDKYRCHRKDLTYHVIDQCGYIAPYQSTHDITMPESIKDLLKTMLDFYVAKYQELNKITNELVMKEANYEAWMIKESFGCLVKTIEKLRRYITDFEQAKWDYSHIKLCDKMLHDKIKEHEEKY